VTENLWIQFSFSSYHLGINYRRSFWNYHSPVSCQNIIILSASSSVPVTFAQIYQSVEVFQPLISQRLCEWVVERVETPAEEENHDLTTDLQSRQAASVPQLCEASSWK